MRELLSWGLGGLMVIAPSVFAADKPLSVKETIVLDAPAEVVWAKIGHFDDMSWHPGIASTEIVDGDEEKPGAKRILTLKDGGKIHETLTARDAKKMKLSYKITESVLPVSEYSATLSVRPEGTRSRVVWISQFKRKAPSDDKAGVDTITGIFQSGLSQLKASLH
ncbi:SRPBCC family protein [Methylobacillus flagellatus]|uniref:SRPBCC family protein n=1 Tax=Methylobacillus flagellatus TaxID=405 RepID=UPI002853F3B2|nr:SRPBCC family protein [Methylobacillus flagellatus]MDR5170516.1 SRPBCC family protein [Methylobacillus flagellatus]